MLACRTARYEAMTPLQDATAVTLLPLDVDQIVAWLTHRFPAGDGIQRRWQPVVQRVRRHPAGRLAKCLGSPLWLFLAVTAYQHEDSRPGELCGLAADELETHLFDRLIPAVGFGDSPWPRYLLAVRVLARTGALPSRPARFLDWAYEAGLVRLAGTAVQFRHRDLQARLAAPRSRDAE